jgi:hypothetical protein
MSNSTDQSPRIVEERCKGCKYLRQRIEDLKNRPEDPNPDEQYERYLMVVAFAALSRV